MQYQSFLKRMTGNRGGSGRLGEMNHFQRGANTSGVPNNLLNYVESMVGLR